MASVVKVAMVTGAGSGVGRQTALALSREGYSMVLVGRRLEALNETAEQLKDGPSSALVISLDVTDAAAVRDAFAKVKERFGRLDVLFNNAGVGAPAVPLEDLPFERWKAVIDTNLTGVFLCIQEAFRMMKGQTPQGGRIINNGSISVHTPRPRSSAYTAAKHGVTGLTKSAALDGRPFNICCGQIDIGNAATPLTKRMSDGVPQANGTTATEPTIDAEHIARAVVYMASLPLDANVFTMTVMATQMPFVGRG
jgi:NAD(P)-dependent dehydrogenase (short-subunit alcohol dehydrogenase family)